MASFTIVEVRNSWLLISFSSPNIPSTLIMYNINSDTLYLPPSSHHRTFAPVASFPVSNNDGLVANSLNFEQAINGVSWKTFRYDVDSIPIEFILMLPPMAARTSDLGSQMPFSSFPLLVVPHGGPHSSFNASFLSPYSFLCIQLNTAIVLVNYRGSTGFGQASVDKLVANIGSVDVSDCVFSINKCLELEYDDVFTAVTAATATATSGQKLIRSDQIAVCGGSHGGFLTAHLIGQFPGMFRVACMRNPVTNIPSMTSSSDIPGTN